MGIEDEQEYWQSSRMVAIKLTARHPHGSHSALQDEQQISQCKKVLEHQFDSTRTCLKVFSLGTRLVYS